MLLSLFELQFPYLSKGMVITIKGLPGGSSGKEPTCQCRRHTSQENPLEEGMVTHSSVLAWRIPGTGEPGRLPSMGLHRVGHN